MHLPPALLSSLRACLGTTALLGAACDQATAAAPSSPALEQAGNTVVAPATASATIVTPPVASATVTEAPRPIQIQPATALDAASSTLDAGVSITPTRGRLRERETTTALAFTGNPETVTRDESTTFVAADPPKTRPKVRHRAKPVAVEPVPTWSCGPCGRG